MTEIYEATLDIFSEGETYDYLLQKISSKIEHYEQALGDAEVAHEKAAAECEENRKFVEKMRDILYQAEKDMAALESIMERQAKVQKLKR